MQSWGSLAISRHMAEAFTASVENRAANFPDLYPLSEGL